MVSENDQNNYNLSNYQSRPLLINKHCKHCLSCQFKGVAKKKELDGTLEKAKWLGSIESAELYITRARQADAIQRMLGVQLGPWGIPHQLDEISQTRARRSLSPLQVCVPLTYTNVKPQQSRITVYPDVVIIPKWSVGPDKKASQHASKAKHRLRKSSSKNQVNSKRVDSINDRDKVEFPQFSVMNQGEIKFRKSPILSPGQFIHFTWLNICKVAAGMKRKLSPSKQLHVLEPIPKVPSFSEMRENKPCRPSREMILCKIVDCDRSQSNFSEESVDTVVVVQ